MPAKILIVDDEQSICDILRKILAREGYQAAQALSGSQALALFEKHEFDLVLLDFMMPDLSGLEVAKAMLETKPMAPIILLSAHGTVSRAVEATKIGVYDFLEKPPDRDRILVTVRNALAKGQLLHELAQYKKEALQKYQMVGQSEAMKSIYATIEKAAPSDVPVLITGENGVGKELVAAAIHRGSARANKRFVKINCGALPANLIESELFGHTKGAFTGAMYAKKGRLETADGGTAFLDEIGDMHVSVQAKLLRFLESGEMQKVGATSEMQVDVRMICATNQDLQKAIQENRFREDLYYRIDVVHIHIPPLRERREDIPLLLHHFLEKSAETNGVPAPHFTPAAERYLSAYPWPGNGRQVRNFVERLMVLGYREKLDLEHIKPHLKESGHNPAAFSSDIQPLKQASHDFERQYILDALLETGGHITRAAEMLGMDRANLHRKMRQLGINPPKSH